MDEQITFIHAADLHLDSPFKGLANVPELIFNEIRNSTFHAFDRLIDAAIHKDVDFILLAGDLFDNEKQSLRAQLRLTKGFEKLRKSGIQVYLSYGNHDYTRGNQYPVTYPENVHVFPDETVRSFTYSKEGSELASIYGFSYEERSVTENKVAEYVKGTTNVPFHIAMLHGSIAGNTEHDVYAPFQRSQLLESEFDYWALGHIHKREIIHEQHPTIVYPGNTQGRHRKETGDKGCYYVQMSKINTELSFIPLHSILFQEVLVDVTECKDIHQVEAVLTKELEKVAKGCPQLIHLTFTSKKDNVTRWEADQLLSELVEIVNETTVDKKYWQYIFKVKTNQQYRNEETILEGDHFLGELFRQFETVEIDSFLSDLYRHRQGRKLLDTLSKEEEKEIKEKAKQLLMNELLKGV